VCFPPHSNPFLANSFEALQPKSKFYYDLQP
jgi:hypothetical protein